MGSIRVIGPYNPAEVRPQMMSGEMAERVAARRLAEQGRDRTLNQSIIGAQADHADLASGEAQNATAEFKKK